MAAGPSGAPELPLHASTQMSLFTSGGAREIAADGCERVVIARECSAEDTRTICENCPVEVEVFAHGALCMCYSGQCFFSSVIGGRSGNRGLCAQLPVKYGWGKKRTSTPLSEGHVPGGLPEGAGGHGGGLPEAGGRMKRPSTWPSSPGCTPTLREGREPTAEELRQLDMPRVQFQCSFTETELTASAPMRGVLHVRQCGRGLKPMNKVASGGELARIMLALKNVLAQQDRVDTLIFDEVDTGVSGRAAQKVAEKLHAVPGTSRFSA